MWNYQSAVSLLVALCISIMPAAAYARYVSYPSQTVAGETGDMADCPFMKEMAAKQGKHSEGEQDRGECAPTACYLKCFHSPAVGASLVELGDLPLCFEVENFSPPLYPPDEPPTPPPQV
jgi:hypothetical protein